MIKRVKILVLLLPAILFVLMACNKAKSYNPKDYLTQQEQDSVLYKTIRYSEKLPPRSTHQTKFDSEFDPYYRKAVANYHFIFLFEGEDGSLYFLMARPAKSITTAYEGIGGKLKVNESDSLVEYEEVFRTWKMPYADLTERGSLLFDRMVTNRDLTIYYPKYTGDKYIEFPDGARFSFDKKSRMWIDSTFDTLNTKN
ncbi:MAG: hypothetical protein DI538_26560 [Azospira oryzae]|jgi:hypothetical protein|nr:MAG: hypothetical protein DI538_26560 [Azospira oryzae]